MPIQLRVLIIVLAVGFFFYVFYLVRKDRAEIRHMSKWLLAALIILFFAIFPNIGFALANLLGIKTFVSFALAMCVGLLVVIALRYQLSLITAEKEIVNLTQRLSILQKEVDDLLHERHSEPNSDSGSGSDSGSEEDVPADPPTGTPVDLPAE
jgi:hypothetical protein